MYYSLRITTEKDLSERLLKFLKIIKATRYLLSKELGNLKHGEHYQGAIQSERKEQTIRKQFKIHFPEFVGNEKYSLKHKYTPYNYKTKIDCDEQIFAYCAKENSTPRSEFVMNITKDEYVGYNLQYWAKNKELVELAKNKSKAAKEKKESLLGSAVNYLCNGNQTLDKKPILPFITDEQIITRLISFYSENKEHLFNQHTFKWLYTKILQLHYKEHYKEFMKKQTLHLLIN